MNMGSLVPEKTTELESKMYGFLVPVFLKSGSVPTVYTFL